MPETANSEKLRAMASMLAADPLLAAQATATTPDVAGTPFERSNPLKELMWTRAGRQAWKSAEGSPWRDEPSAFRRMLADVLAKPVTQDILTAVSAGMPGARRPISRFDMRPGSTFVPPAARPELPMQPLPQTPAGYPSTAPNLASAAEKEVVRDAMTQHAGVIEGSLREALPEGYKIRTRPSNGESVYVQVRGVDDGRPVFEARVSNHADAYGRSNITVDPAAPNSPQQVVDAFRYHMGMTNERPSVLWSTLDPKSQRQHGGTAVYAGRDGNTTQAILERIKQLFTPAGAAVGAAYASKEE